MNGAETRAILSSSLRVGSPIAEALARDIAECSDDDLPEPAVDGTTDTDRQLGHALYARRASSVAYGASRPVVNDTSAEDAPFTQHDLRQSREAERSLLRDNHILPPKHQKKNTSIFGRLYRQIFSTKIPVHDDDANGAVPTETSPLLNGQNASPPSISSDHLEEQWEEAVTSGRIRTTWQREAKTLIQYSVPLILTFMLQYSINVTSIFAVGHIGKIELGAVSRKFSAT